MTSIREALRQILQRRVGIRPDIHDSEFSYAIHWTAMARNWDTDQRRRVHAIVRDRISQSDFIANEFERRYSLDEIDEEKHSGASLVALDKVLTSFAARNDQEE